MTRVFGSFRAMCRHIARDPEVEPAGASQVEEECSGLLLWEKLPSEFRVSHPQQGGARWWATRVEQLEQRRVYAQYAQWAERCGFDELDLRAELDRVPANREERGTLGIPEMLRERRCVKCRHAVLALRAAAYVRAAAAAGRELGDQEQAAPAKVW